MMAMKGKKMKRTNDDGMMTESKKAMDEREKVLG